MSRRGIVGSLLLAALAGVASCGGDGTTDPPPPPPPPPPPVAPVAVGSIPAQVLIAGQEVTVDVTPFFSDPDGGALTYAAASSDEAVVAVALSGSSLTVTAVAAGTATVTVTATDPDGLSATQSVGLTVEAANRAPEAVGTIPAQTMTAGESATVDVSPFFSDPDGDELTYGAESSAPEVVAVAVEGSSLTVTAVAAGTATVTVTATDPDGLAATQSAEVTVEAANQAPEAVGTIPAQSLEVGDEAMVDVSPLFSDPDGDELTYGAESSAPEAVAVAVEGSVLTVTAVAAGTATVTVTATDPDGLSAAQSAEVTVVQPNRAPEAVGELPAQSLEVGDEATVDVASFFSDPDGDELMYGAESSAPEAVAVAVEGSSLTVTAAAAGTATVTVTATDPDGLSAAQSAEVTVVQPNRAPEAVGTIPAQVVRQFETATLEMFWFFRDRDGDELAYAAESSDAGVAAARLEGSLLTLEAVGGGMATVTVTASDPGGLAATQSVAVDVEGGGGFRDDFNDAASLDDWTYWRSSAEVVDGVAHLTSDGSHEIATMDREFEAPVAEWRVGMRVARPSADNAMLLYLVTGNHRFKFWRVALGPFSEANYTTSVWDRQTNDYFTATNLSGDSEAISDLPNEFMDIRLSHENEELVLVVDDTELYRLPTANATFRGVNLSEMLHNVETIWIGTHRDQSILVDWAYANGAEIGGDAARATGSPPLGDSGRAAGDAEQGRLGSEAARPPGERRR